MSKDKVTWRVKYDGQMYELKDYQVYHLTDGRKDYAVHEINFRGKVFTARSLEKLLAQVGKEIRRNGK